MNAEHLTGHEAALDAMRGAADFFRDYGIEPPTGEKRSELNRALFAATSEVFAHARETARDCKSWSEGRFVFGSIIRSAARKTTRRVMQIPWCDGDVCRCEDPFDGRHDTIEAARFELGVTCRRGSDGYW